MTTEGEVGALRVSLSIDTAEFTERVSDINNRLRAVRSEFNAAGDGTRAFANSMDGMRAKQEMLTRQLDLQRQKVQALRQRYQEVAAAEGENSRAAINLAAQYNNQVGVLNRTEASLRSTESRLRELTQEAERNSSVWGRLQSRFSAVGERLSSVGGKMKDVGSNIASSFGAAFLAVGGGLGVAAKKAMDFESQMSSVKSVMAPDEVKEFGGQLEKLAITMGAKTKYSATEAAEGIEELVKAGVSVKDIINGGLDGALSLATAGELKLADAANIASTALNAFKDDNITVSQAADILAGAANASATDVGELKFGLSAVAAVASGVGESFKDTTTALAVFAQNGLKGSDAGTSLKTMLLNLTPHTDQAAGMMDELNLGTTNAAAGFKWLVDKGIKPVNKTTDEVAKSLMELAKQQAGAGASAGKIAKEYDKLSKTSGFASTAFYDQNGNLKSMSEISGVLHNALKGLNSQQRQNALQTMFGTDAIRAGNILYKEGAKGIDDMAAAMGKVKAADVAKQKLDNVKGSIEQLKGSMETAGIAIGNALLPGIRKVAETIGSLVDKFNGLSPQMQHFIAIGSVVSAAFLGIVAAIGGLVAIIGGAITGIGTIGTFLLGTAESAGFLATAFSVLTGPIGLVIAAIAGLIVAGIAIYKNWDSISKFLSNTWNVIAQTAVTVWNGIKNFFSQWGTTLLASLAGPIGLLVLAVVKHWDTIKNTTISIWNGITSSLSNLWNNIKTSASNVWNGIKSVASSVWNGIKTAIVSIVDALVKSVQNYYNNMKSGITSIMSGIKSILSGVWSAIKNIFLGAVLLILDLVTGNFKKLKSDAQGIMNNLKSAMQSIWNGIKSVISGVASAIKGYVTTTWNNIKTITTNVWNAIKSISSSVWNGIKSLVSSVVNGIKSAVSAAWNGIKSAIISSNNATKTAITSAWNAIKSFIPSAISAIKTAVVNGFNSLKSSVSTAMNNVKSAIETGWNKAKSFLEGIDLKQIGKNIIQGLINGIGSLIGDVKQKAKDVADAVTGTLRKILDIHSPSRETHKLGEHTGQGFANGIAAKKKAAEKAAREVAIAAKKSFSEAMDKADYKFKMGQINSAQYIAELRKIRNEYAKTPDQVRKVNLEIKSIQDKSAKELKAIQEKTFKDALKKIKDKAAANKISTGQELTQLQALAKKYKKNSDEKLQVDKEIAKVKKQLAKEEEDRLNKQFEKEKAYIEDKKNFNKLSLNDELKLYQKYLKEYKRGSEQRKYWEQQVYNVKKEIYDKLKSINDDYVQKVQETNQKLKDGEIQAEKDYNDKITSIKEQLNSDLLSAQNDYANQVQAINDKLAQDEQALTDEYVKAVDDRTKALYDFAGIFDQVTRQDVDGQSLVNNLQGQVDAFKDYQTNMDELASKGVDQGLLQELQDAGPKSVDQIKALNSLSAGQLQQYVALWQQKSSLARQQAVKESEGLRLDTQIQIQQLRADANMQLDQLRVDYVAKIAQLRAESQAQMNQAKTDWVNTVKQLRVEANAQMSQYKKDLKAQISDVTKGTKEQFDVMSASMKDIGKNTMQGLMNGLSEMTGPLLAQAKSIADSISKTIKKALDIHSPSRVMMEIGQFTGQGLALGMANSIRNITQQANAMARAAIPEIRQNVLPDPSQVSTSSQNAMPGTNITQNVTINSPTPLSPSEIARQNKIVLQQMAFAMR